MSFSPEAEDAFAEFAADCGREAYKTPSACETYLNQYLEKYPTELELLIAALRVGVPKRIAAQDARVGYDDFLSQLADKFAAAAHTDREAATWAVGAWAFAVGKPVGFVGGAADPTAGRVYEDAGPPPNERLVRRAMAMIVTAGGFLGGAVGAALLPVLVMASDVAAAYHSRGTHVMSAEMTQDVTVLLVLGLMVGAGLIAALGAMAGWWMGQGEERPWATFGVAFGTALTTTMFLLFCLTPILKPVILFGAVFGATYKSAARGGREFV
jgi:hypothetical protein